MISIFLEKNISASPVQVITTLLEHEELYRFFNAKFKLIKEQDEGEMKGGKGTVRLVSMLGVRFEERIISADNQHIHYQIVGNQLVANHRGYIHVCFENKTVTPLTQVTYQISCKSPWWLPSFLLRFLIKKDIKLALTKLATHFKVDDL